MKVKIAVCSDIAIQDTKSNLMSLTNITEQINAHSFPAAHPSLWSVFLVTKTEEEPNTTEFQLIYKLVDKVVFDHHFTVDFQDKNRLWLRVNTRNLVFSNPGPLTSTLLHQGSSLGSWEMDVMLIGGAEVNIDASESTS